MSLSHPTDDLRVAEILPLIQPALLMHDLPLGEQAAALVESSRRKAEAILSGRDDRLLVIAGPCSIHDRSEANIGSRDHSGLPMAAKKACQWRSV